MTIVPVGTYGPVGAFGRSGVVVGSQTLSRLPSGQQLVTLQHRVDDVGGTNFGPAVQVTTELRPANDAIDAVLADKVQKDVAQAMEQRREAMPYGRLDEDQAASLWQSYGRLATESRYREFDGDPNAVFERSRFVIPEHPLVGTPDEQGAELGTETDLVASPPLVENGKVVAASRSADGIVDGRVAADLTRGGLGSEPNNPTTEAPAVDRPA